ncbi:hypothetical protein D7231_02405 [Streptomyces klenkii]|uniref:Uncharacterized protein n=1 Tax=Streptomyces klenkii TaxID=1420899 RepID=A0A3B0BYT5_9ACTN|nr:hypothetical protein D7231_02405 [Streptomyces klenkii]
MPALVLLLPVPLLLMRLLPMPLLLMPLFLLTLGCVGLPQRRNVGSHGPHPAASLRTCGRTRSLMTPP